VTYRVGNHQPQNLYRDDRYIGVCFDPADTQLIVDVLNPHTPDVTYLHGVREALGAIGTWLMRVGELHGGINDDLLAEGLRVVAHELGLDEDAPSAHTGTPQSDQNGSGVPEPTPGRSRPAEIESGRFDVWGEVTVDGGWLEMACNTCRAWSPDTADVTDLAELVQHATEHAEVCP